MLTNTFVNINGKYEYIGTDGDLYNATNNALGADMAEYVQNLYNLASESDTYMDKCDELEGEIYELNNKIEDMDMLIDDYVDNMRSIKETLSEYAEKYTDISTREYKLIKELQKYTSI